MAPEAPLVAETGGLNAMIVDSTALPEQVVRDVLASSSRVPDNVVPLCGFFIYRKTLLKTYWKCCSAQWMNCGLAIPGY